MVEEEESLMNGDDTGKGKNDDYGSKTFCVKHWKVAFAGIGVILLITLGVVVGAAFSRGNSQVTRVGRNQNRDIRLPGNVIPEKYKLYLHPNITDNKFGFSGRVRILVQCVKPTNNIIIHLKNLNIDKVTVIEGDSAFDGTGSESKTLVSIDKKNKKKLLHFDKKSEFMIINLNGESLKKGKNYVVLIVYHGSLSGGLEGFYKSSYKNKAGETRYLATTHFESTMARTAFPCFDEPAMKAKFKIIVVKEPQHHALSNMPIENNVTRTDGLIDVHFQESVKMSTYLVAFIVCDYKFKYSKTSRGTEVRVWAPPDQIEQAQFAIDAAPKCLEYYEKFFKVNFPLPKQDLIAIPDFAAGAMENWGLITYRLTSILYDEKESSSANKQWVAVVIAHELAHQWFGNLVTMKWWNDLWLNEGFAAFVEFIGANHINSTWQMMDQFIIDDVQSSMALDSHVNSHPISVPVHDPAQINEIFDTISYDKGASIVRMMKNFLGSDVFHEGLTKYLKKYQFGNAVSDDLWKSLTDAAEKKGKKMEKNVKDVMDTWTLQMGYPVITVKKEGDNAAVLTQSHFIVDDVKPGDIKPSKYNYKWHVPLTYYTENNNTHKLSWFYKEDQNVRIQWDSTAGWLKINANQVGFYRVNYDDDNWQSLSEQLINDHKKIPIPDRSNLIDDAFELAKANLMDQTKALDMTAYLKNETEYVPWISALSSLGYIGSMLQGNEDYKSAYSYYEKYIVDQVKDLANKLGWKDDGSHLDKYLRGSLLRSAIAHGDTASIEKGKKVFKNWKVNKIAIPPNLRSAAYLAAIKYGGADDWHYLFNIYKTTQFPSEQRKLMFALTDTKNKTILQKYLKMSMDSNIVRSQDSCSVIEHIALNPVSQEMAYDFVQKNWDKLYKRYGKGSFDMSRLIKSVFGRFTSQKKYEEVEKFLSTHEVGSGKLAAKQAVAAVKNHIAWLKKNGKAVNDWLATKVKTATEKRSNFM